MTIGKAAALTAALVSAVAVGVAIGPFVTHRGDSSPVSPAPGWDLGKPSTAATQPVTTEEAPPVRIVRPARPKAGTANAERTDKSASRNQPKVSLSAPALAERLKPVLNRGANMTVAADGFHDAEQFAAVAHAARNTKVPFMVLKHRVLDEKQSLADALGAAKPTLDAAAEARRARTEAQSDVKAVAATFAN